MNERINSFFEKYNDNSYLRASINLIPYIGSSLDILITSKIQKKNIERFNLFLTEIKNQINKLDENKINYQYLESEEFYDLFIQTSNAAIKTRLIEKIRIYSFVIKDSLINEKFEILPPEDIIFLINELTESDIKFIKIVSCFINDSSKNKNIIDGVLLFRAEQISSVFQKYSIEFISIGLLKLNKHNLIIKNFALQGGYKDAEHFYSLTPLFYMILNYLNKKI